MSAFNDIDKTLRTALSNLGLLDNLDGTLQLIGENTGFNPETDLGIGVDTWAETFQLPAGVDSMMKGTGGFPAADENIGIFQVTVFTRNTNDGSTELETLVDLIATEFTHGKIFTDFQEVHIQNTSRNNGRNEGGFFQIDVSINWFAYVDRP